MMGSDGSQIVRDFSGLDRGEGMDARETSLRMHSTNFGNFVADAIRAATGAEMALVNSGCFRIDDSIPSRIMERDLSATFIFDEVGAVSVIELTADEVIAIYQHSLGKGGSGAFLQVSESIECAAQRRGKFNVAIVKYLLEQEGDGYQKVLDSPSARSAPSPPPQSKRDAYPAYYQGCAPSQLLR
jgi:2',3'-cyclic-nucleotide 2'-phosphodiesterase (5'-nucleotidase family)